MSDDLLSQRAPMVTKEMCAYGRVVAEPRLSSDAKFLAFVATLGGRGALVLRESRADGRWGPELVITSAPAVMASRPYGGGVFCWLPDTSALIYAASGGGDDGGGLWLQPVGGGPATCIAEGVLTAPAVSPDGTKLAYVLDTHHVEVLTIDNLDTLGAVRLSGDVDFCFDPVWSPDGEWVAWHEWNVPAMPWDSSRIVMRRADGSGEVRAIGGGDGISVQQPRFSPDGTWLSFLCDVGDGGWLNIWGNRWKDGNGPIPLVAEPHELGAPSWGQGQRSYAWSPDSSSIAYCRNERGFGSLQIAPVSELAMDEGGPIAARQLDRGVYGGLDWVGGSGGNECLVAVRSGARTPTCIVGWTEIANTANRERLAVGPLAGFEAADLGEPEVVSWQSEDGVVIPARLYRPLCTTGNERDKGASSVPPLIAWVHGGPTDQWGVAFNPRIAYWVARGWAVLVPDHRGSTGHGRAFTQALAGRWGELDVVDVAAGLRAAIKEGWGDERRLVVMGGSAGGFTVLNLLSVYPGLCAAGIDLYGVADLIDLARSTHRFEAHYCDSLVGPLPETEDLYRSRSPINRAKDIVDPLLILQGLDDQVVPPAQSKAIADRLLETGRIVELHLYEAEGHGWRRPETVIDELGRIESFLQRHVLDRGDIA